MIRWQLRPIDSDVVIVDLYQPPGKLVSWQPEPGRAPRGLLQWWLRDDRNISTHEPQWEKFGDEFWYVNDSIDEKLGRLRALAVEPERRPMGRDQQWPTMASKHIKNEQEIVALREGLREAIALIVTLR